MNWLWFFINFFLSFCFWWFLFGWFWMDSRSKMNQLLFKKSPFMLWSIDIKRTIETFISVFEWCVFQAFWWWVLFTFESFQIVLIRRSFTQYHSCSLLTFSFVNKSGNCDVIMALIEILLLVHHSDFLFWRNKFIFLFLNHPWNIALIKLDLMLCWISWFLRRPWSWSWLTSSLNLYPRILIVEICHAKFLVHILWVFILFGRLRNPLVIKGLRSTIHILTCS